jgi:hypothetical protein
MDTQTSNPRFGERFDAAMKEIRKGKVVARRNIASCCRGCYETGVADDQPIIWHFGGQGNHMDVYSDGAYYRYSKRGYVKVEKIYFNHSNLVDASGITAAGQHVVDTFKKHGIAIEWDQTNSDCVAVNVQMSLHPDFKYENDSTLAFV